MGKIYENGCITEHVAPVSGGIETQEIRKHRCVNNRTGNAPHGKC